MITACGGGAINGARDGVDGLAYFCGKVCGDHAAAPLWAFDDEGGVSPCGYDAVAHGEGLLVGLLMDGEF